MLAEAETWLGQTLKASEGETVIYYVGGDSFGVTAVIGQTLVGFDLGNGVLQTWQTNDFLILTEDMILNESQILPENGQIIERTILGVSKRFRASNADDGRCFRYTDPNRVTLRIHTKEVP